MKTFRFNISASVYTKKLRKKIENITSYQFPRTNAFYYWLKTPKMILNPSKSEHWGEWSYQRSRRRYATDRHESSRL